MGRATEHRLDVGLDNDLHYWTLGERESDRPVLILLHGMRDVGRSMLPIARRLSDRYLCVMPDLRGHGKSVQPGSYAMQHFLMDLRRLHKHLDVQTIHLFGHSLGGHIACRYAGLYGREVETLIVVEGLGPPPREVGNEQTQDLEHIAAALDRAVATADRASAPRTIASIADASARLVANNPRLDPDWAMQLSAWATREAVDGKGVVWAFDPRAQEVFLGISDARSFDYWRAVEARTLIVTGDLGHLYWQQMRDVDSYSGRFSELALAERIEAFSGDHRAEHLQITGAGHQVHYDQPEQLAQAVSEFLPD